MTAPAAAYRHRQSGTLILAVLGIAAVTHLLLLALVSFEGEEKGGRLVLWLTLLLLVATLVCFHSLTITVGGGRLTWQFGPGPIRKSVALEEVVEARATRMSALAGWGIRWTPKGWLYNVSGLDAVEVTLRSGKRFFLGTDEPDRLVAAIAAARVGAPTT